MKLGEGLFHIFFTGLISIIFLGIYIGEEVELIIYFICFFVSTILRMIMMISTEVLND